LSAKDIAEVCRSMQKYRTTYFAVKYETFSALGGLLNIMQVIWTFLCNILWL